MSADPPTATAWAEVPELPGGRDQQLPPPARELLALLVAGVGPLARSLVLPEGGPVVVAAAIAVVTLLAGALGARRWWWARLSLALLGGALVARSEGELLGLWTVAGVVLADWGVRRRPPLPGLPAPAATVTPGVVVIMLVAAWRGRLGLTGPSILLWPVLAGVLLLVGSWFGDCVGRVIGAVGRWVGHAVTVVVFGLLSIPLVLLPWLVQRLARVDPLRSGAGRTRDGTAWHPRARGPRQAGRPWAPDGASGSHGWWPRLRVGAVALALLALAVLGVRWSTGGSGGGGEVSAEGTAVPVDGIPAAYEGQDWYPTYRDDIQWIINQRTAFRPLHSLRIRDVRSTWVNVQDGRRRTWRAPDCGGCRRLTVWMYGGSTTFGLGQRDEHTIPSEVARLAAADGLVVDVVNKGVPGDMHWEEAQRFAWDVTREPAPDMVVFYDGVNEIWGTQTLANQRVGDVAEPVEPLTEDVWNGFLRTEGGPVPEAPDDARLAPTTTLAGMSPEELGLLAVRRYDRSRGMSRDTAAARGLPVEWFWQPSRLSRPPIPGEPAGPGQRYARAFYRSAESNVPAGVRDLTRVLDGTRVPLFSDDVHHNEVGARLIAAAMYQDLAPRFRSLAAAPSAAAASSGAVGPTSGGAPAVAEARG